MPAAMQEHTQRATGDAHRGSGFVAVDAAYVAELERLALPARKRGQEVAHELDRAFVVGAIGRRRRLGDEMALVDLDLVPLAPMMVDDLPAEDAGEPGLQRRSSGEAR